jgi:hypothetical protein
MSYDRTMIVIRERSFTDLLDLALLVVRDRPVTIGLAALAGIAPFAVFNYWLLAQYELRLLWVFIVALETPWATAPLTLALGDLMFGVRPRPQRMLKVLLLSVPSLFIAQAVVRGVLLAFVVSYLFVPAYFGFLNEVILLERAQGLRSIKSLLRSRALSQGQESDFVMRWLGQLALGVAFAFCFYKGNEAFASAFKGGELSWYQPGFTDFGGILFQAGIWIAIAYFGVVRFLSYIDRRIRLEGWEIELRLKAVGRALEERTA